MKKIIFLMLASLLISGCAKKTAEKPVEKVQLDEKAYSWFSFSEGSVKKTKTLNEIPFNPVKPWTQAVSITSISSSERSENGKAPEAYAVVNRSGILVFEGKDFELVSDQRYFKGKTCGNLFFYQNTPFILTYRNSFFDDREKTGAGSIHTFLVQLDEKQKILYPVLTVENLGAEENSEVTGIVYDGKSWTTEIKSQEDGQIKFSYRNFQAKEDFLSINPENAEKYIFVTDSSVEKYRNGLEAQNFRNAPERVKKLLSSLPEKLPLSIEVFNAGGHTQRVFERNPSEEMLYASALLSENWAFVLFEDGTLFMNGALYNRPLMNQGKTVCIRLPSLPEGFKYSGGHAAVSGDYFYAVWEESSLYETGRAGFIQIDLGSILYGEN